MFVVADYWGFVQLSPPFTRRFKTLASEIRSKNRCLMVRVFGRVLGARPTMAWRSALNIGKIDRLAQSKL